jgi:hypothetical protein
MNNWTSSLLTFSRASADEAFGLSSQSSDVNVHGLHFHRIAAMQSPLYVL